MWKDSCPCCGKELFSPTSYEEHVKGCKQKPDALRDELAKALCRAQGHEPNEELNFKVWGYTKRWHGYRSNIDSILPIINAHYAERERVAVGALEQAFAWGKAAGILEERKMYCTDNDMRERDYEPRIRHFYEQLSTLTSKPPTPQPAKCKYCETGAPELCRCVASAPQLAQVSEEDIERVAKRLTQWMNGKKLPEIPNWDRLQPLTRAAYREQAKAAIAAMAGKEGV